MVVAEGGTGRDDRQGETGGESADPVSASASLRLASKWARHRRDQVSWGQGNFGGARSEPVLRIHHGSVPIFVRDLGKCLVVLGVIDIPGDVRSWLTKRPQPEKAEFLQHLLEVLMSCPRIGFSLASAAGAGDDLPERAALDQTLQVSENDAASFNRFCDAIQETETVLLRVSELVHSTLARAEVRPVYSSSLPAPRDLYL